MLVLRGLFLIFGFLWALGTTLHWLFNWKGMAFVGIAGFIPIVLASLIVIPPQMIAVASCRPVNLLGNMRATLLVLLIFICSLISLIIYVPLSGGMWWNLNSPFIVIFLMVSLFAALSIWICSHLSGMHGLLMLLNMFFDDFANWLSGFDFWLLSVSVITLWLIFSYWWLHWRPKKYQQNPALMSKQQSKDLLAGRQATLFSGHAKSWIGSRLIGMPDGVNVHIKRWLFVLGAVTLLMGPGFYFFNSRAPQEFTVYLFILCIYFIAFCLAQAIAMNLFNNLRYLWLHIPAKRESFFLLVLKRYCIDLFPLALLCILGGFFIRLYVDAENMLINWPVLFSFLLLLFGLIFYFSWIVYQRSAYKLAWYLGSVLTLPPLWIGTVIMTGAIFPLPTGWQTVSPVWIISIQLIAIIAMHWVVRKGMAELNFTRLL